MRVLWLALLLASGQAAFACDPAPEPVISLSYGSRYEDDSKTRSKIDAKADADVDDAVRPVDDFLRALTTQANSLADPATDAAAVADCLIAQLGTWAEAGALSDLQSETSNLTVGSRLAGFGLVMLQVAPHATRPEDTAVVLDWLTGLMRAQQRFWEAEAPNGARRGNLRAWAALGGSTLAALTDDPALRAWAAWSASYVLCTAEADGSLPQEMSRGKFALKYQLHAIAPLVVSVVLLDRQGVSLTSICDQALARSIGFALADIDNGTASEAITGKRQSFFDGTDELEPFHLAWLEAWLLLAPAADRPGLEAVADSYRPLTYSKLGGNQTLLWRP